MGLKVANRFKLLVIFGAGILLCTVPGFTQTKSTITKGTTTKPSRTVVPTATPANSNWILQTGPLANIRVVAPNKQLFLLDNGLNLAVIENGKIEIYCNQNGTQWNKQQTLEVPEVMFTSFLAKDINDDGIPEIVAGTTDPGFIYVYYLDSNQQWVSTTNGKYIWSAVTKLTTAKAIESQSTAKPSDAQTVKVAGNKIPYVIVQNKEGFVFVLKISETALDLAWKSPAASRPIDTVVAMDLDNDSNEELVAVYKSGGIGVLKIMKNAIISKWETFPWGKVLSFNYNDWDNDNRTELILTTTQKLVYRISQKDGQYTASQQGFDYVIEKLFFTKLQNRRVVFASDNSGKVHQLEWSSKLKQWKEVQTFTTGRILDFLEKEPGEILLVNQSLQVFVLNGSN